MVAATPKTSQYAGFQVSKYGGAVNDPRLRGIIHWNFDHIDAEQGSTVITRNVVNTLIQFFFFTNASSTRVVDQDLAIWRRTCHHRMGVRTAASLHSTYLHRAAQIGDVEDAQSPETVQTGIYSYTFQATVKAATRLLD